jgi:lysozyme
MTLVEQLIRHEGLRLFPYLDSATPPRITIGVGRNLTDVGISRDEAIMLLMRDIDEATADLERSFLWFAGLSEARRHALIDMRFNLGPTRFRGFRATLAALAKGDYATAAVQMRASLWARQVGKRAETLARMVEKG